MANSVKYWWRCEGCGESGSYDPEVTDILAPLHHCPKVTGPFAEVPVVHISEKENDYDE